MRKWIRKFIIGLPIIIILCFCLYWIVNEKVHQYYYSQLEDLIINRYMDGHYSIGSISFDVSKQKTPLNAPGIYTENSLEYLTDTTGRYKMIPSGVNSYSWYPEGLFNNIHLLNELSNGDIYQSWVGTNYLKCMVVKKNNYGFNFIEEMIFGIGFKYDISNNFLWVEKEMVRPIELATNDDRNELNDYEYGYAENVYLSNFSLCNDYVTYLINEKYKDIEFKQTYDELMKLRMNPSALDNNSSYFHNDYYELRLDDSDQYCLQETHKYGNDFNTLYGITSIFKYVIVPIGNKLDIVILKVCSLITLLVILFWLVFCYQKVKD